MTDLTEFWNHEHRANSGWLTGTDWPAMQRYYGISDQDIQHKSCLEIGVGKATVTRALAALAQPLYCCDISSAALAKTKDLAAQSWLTEDLDQVPAVDIVLCHLVLVHCDDAECVRILRSIRLKSEGRIFCQFSSFRDHTVGISEASERVKRMLDLDRKHRFRTTEQIQDIVHSAGLQIHNIKQHDPGSYHGWRGQFWQFLELRKENEKGQ